MRITLSLNLLFGSRLIHCRDAGERAGAISGPYKLGMFQEVAGPSLASSSMTPSSWILSRADSDAPATLRGLIERWDEAMAARIAALAVAARRSPAAYVIPLAQLTTLPPLSDPDVILMAARNYVEHAEEMANVGRTSGNARRIDETLWVGLPGVWAREPTDGRPNPYLFPKLKSALAADGDAIILPPGRPNIDYECELVAVMGRNASRVSVGDALDYYSATWPWSMCRTGRNVPMVAMVPTGIWARATTPSGRVVRSSCPQGSLVIRRISMCATR